MSEKGIDRAQNITIVTLLLTAVLLFTSLPLFGDLSDRSLLELAREHFRREETSVGSGTSDVAHLALPVRMVYTNDYARLGAGMLTTLSDEFERAGTYLGEALGSANNPVPISELVFLSALRGEGLYFDFTSTLPSEVLFNLLGVTAAKSETETVRRVLLAPAGENDAVLYVQDGAGAHIRFSTAVSSADLMDFLASQSGVSASFAYLLGASYAQLSPYTIVLNDTESHNALSASNVLSAGEETFLRRAGFNAHAENRFTESSGTVIVREATSMLYLRPDGTVDYQGSEAARGTIYYVPAAEPGAPTPAEAAAAAQTLVATLMQDFLGSASLYLSSVERGEESYEICFDLMVDGIPVRFADGSHAASVIITDQHVAAFSLKARRYAQTDTAAQLLPFSLSSAVAATWNRAELIVAYVDAGGDRVDPAWIAE